MANNRFGKMRVQAEVLEKLEEQLNDILRFASCEYKVVGKEEEQSTDWKTGELLWEDEEHTIPKYRDRFDYVPLPEEELPDECRLRVEVCKEFIKKLDKLI